MDAILNSEVSIAMLENSPLYEAKPLTTKSRKAVWYPSDYSSTSMLQNMPSDLEANAFGDWVMGMVPVVVTSGTGINRNFTVEVSINFEVVPDQSTNDTYALGISSFLVGSFDNAMSKISGLIKSQGPKLLSMAFNNLKFP